MLFRWGNIHLSGIQEVDDNSDRKRETACKRPGMLSEVHALPLTHHKSRDDKGLERSGILHVQEEELQNLNDVLTACYEHFLGATAVAKARLCPFSTGSHSEDL